MSTFTPDELRAQLRAQKIPEHLIDQAVALASGERTATMIVDEQTVEADEARDERAVVVEGDRQMRARGFAVWNLSQPRASKIAAGVPDRLYTHPARRLAAFWEAKSATGRQRPDQRVFQEHMDACGIVYLLGTDAVLTDWLATVLP